LIRIGQSMAVSDPSQIAGARRLASLCAENLGLSATVAGKAALVATELATNLVKHGGGGSILFGGLHDSITSLVMIGIDRGNGIANVTRAMEDGYSTAGSPGTGLGAISRNASSFDLYSQASRGTAILCRIDSDAPKRPGLIAPRMLVGGVCMPKPGEDQPGDAWTAIESRDFVTVAIADGLGHGSFASTASSAAVRIIAERAEWPVEEILKEAHGSLRATRGAAVGIARLFHGQNRVEFSGVGNIAGTIVTEETSRRTVSMGGIVGHEMRRVQSFSYPWNGGNLLILASDGISTSWNLSNYPGLMQRDPALIAAILYRDHCRGNDDATVVVVKIV
jgi:anti-sigma regulatory factor (Ser/Thr protein kinase)/serine/threonine protein phosphatase PrpC